jgi:hypothetical protein
VYNSYFKFPFKSIKMSNSEITIVKISDLNPKRHSNDNTLQ